MAKENRKIKKAAFEKATKENNPKRKEETLQEYLKAQKNMRATIEEYRIRRSRPRGEVGPGELGPAEKSAPGELGPISRRTRPHQPENSAPCSRRTRPLNWRTRPHSVAV